MHPHSSKELPVIVVGAGGHARVLMDLLELIGREVLFATDRDPARHGKTVGEVEIRSDEAVLAISPDKAELVNAIGSVATMDARQEVCDRFHKLGYHFATLIHPSAVISSRARLGEGVQVLAGAVIQPGARVGPNSLVNTRASIDHDCLIGAHVHIAPGVTLSGAVHIGDATHIGTGATIIQGITVGRNVTVAAGAVVAKDVENGQRVAGVPARPMRKETAPATTHPHTGEDYGIMVSAIGRRVVLARLLRQSASALGLRPRLVATDINRHGAAFHIGDDRKVVPPYSDPDCMNRLLDLCREQHIRFIVPTIDPDLPFYAANQDAFRAVGTEVMVSSPQTIRIVNDKELTHQWFLAQGIPTVRQIASSALLDGAAGWSFPVFIKPRGGSSSIGARAVRDRDELRTCTRDGEYIAQEIAPGKEYTIDVYVDRHGKCLAAVPRLRLETRGGEVVKAMTVHCPAIEAMARQIAETLPGARGALNIQIFHDPALGSLKAIEINARFGGGYPLTHQAGAPMTQWAIEESLGLVPSVTSDPWTDGMCMLRYDDAIFIDREETGLEWPIPRR